MPASPPQPSLHLLHTVKHSPITRTVTNTNDDAENEHAARDSPSPELNCARLATESQNIEQKPEFTHENIDSLLSADLVESPVSVLERDMDLSTLSASASEEVLIPIEAKEEKRIGISEPPAAMPTNNNQYQFYYPPHYPPQPAYSYGECGLNAYPSVNQSWLQYPCGVSLLAIGNAADTDMQLFNNNNLKRKREEALAPIPEKAFAANPRSPTVAAEATKLQSSPLVNHGFSIAHPVVASFESFEHHVGKIGQQQSGFVGLELLSNVSSASSHAWSLPVAIAAEAANTNTFSYPTKKVTVLSEPKHKTDGCKCKQSNCLKLYCACFRDDKICLDCQCVRCANTEAESGTEGQLTVAKQTLLLKRPNAFGDKSCRCSKSQCLKMYCVCFSSGNPCGTRCKCQDCKNPKGGRADQIQIQKRLQSN